MSKRKTFEEFIEQAKIKHNNINYFYDKNTFINTHNKMRIICPKHGEFWQSPKSHLLYGCEKCSYEKRGKQSRLTTIEFINKSKEVHGDKYDYSNVIYEKTRKPICIICKKHGEFWQKPNDHLNGKGCPKCNESKLEKETEDVLKKLCIEYIFQYKSKWLGKQILDFYLPEYNIAIECQGKQHFGYGGWSDEFDFNKQYSDDIKKNRLCLENGIKISYIASSNDKKLINKNISYYNEIYYNIYELIEKIKG
jgi:very-short-patch-repair endonuclease